MRFTKGLSITAVAAAAMLVLGACAGDGGDAPPVDEDVEFDAGTTMAQLNADGEITIGTKFDQPLFGLANLDGDPEGFDIEIGKIIAGALGIPESGINWVETVSANREPFIENGTVDLVIATYTINDTRKQVVDFAGPYYIAGQDLLVLAGNPAGITGPDDLADAVVCTVTGSTSEKNISEYATKQIMTTDTYAACLEPVRRNVAQALTTDNVILSGFVDQNPGEFELLNEPFTAEPYGIGLKKGDQAFRDFINDTLEAAFEDGRWADAWERTAGKVLPLPDTPTLDRY